MVTGREHELTAVRSITAIEEVLDSVTDQVLVWDAARRLVFANAAVLAWVGRPLADIRGSSLVDLVGTNLHEHLTPYFEAASAGAPVRYLRRLDGPDGRTHTLSVRVSACVESGILLGYVVLGTDLAEQADAQALQRDLELTRQLLGERDRIAVELDTGVAGRLSAARAALTVAGEGPDLATSFAGVVGRLDDAIAELRRLIEGMHTPVSEPAPAPLIRVRQHTSAEPWNPQRPTLVDDTLGDPWTFAHALAFVDELPGLSVWNTEQVNCFANRAAVEGLGLRSRSEMVGRDRDELFGPDVADRGRPYAQAAARGEIQRYDSHFVDGSGTERTIHFVYYPIRRAGQPIGMVAVLHDVDPTDASVTAESAVTTLAADRRRIGEDLHDHVIQQLYAAGLALDSAAGRDDPASVVDHAAQCIDAAMAALAASTRHLHADAGTGLTDSVERAVRRAGAALGFAPRLDLIGDLDTIDPGTAVELMAVLIESLSNAARHAAATDVHVTLSAGPGRLWLRVADNGVGIGGTSRSSGLTNMANRAARLRGSFRHRDNAPRGTVLDWQVPVTSIG